MKVGLIIVFKLCFLINFFGQVSVFNADSVEINVVVKNDSVSIDVVNHSKTNIIYTSVECLYASPYETTQGEFLHGLDIEHICYNTQDTDTLWVTPYACGEGFFKVFNIWDEISFTGDVGVSDIKVITYELVYYVKDIKEVKDVKKQLTYLDFDYENNSDARKSVIKYRFKE